MYLYIVLTLYNILTKSYNVHTCSSKRIIMRACYCALTYILPTYALALTRCVLSLAVGSYTRTRLSPCYVSRDIACTFQELQCTTTSREG